MKAAVLLVTIVLLVLGIVATAKYETPTVNASAGKVNCSDGWRITGYYTPVEDDFTTPETREVEIRGLGRETFKETFNADFLRTIFDDDKGYGEGWGKTRFGWYLGNYNGGWHKADAPLDANDKPLQADAVAVDRSVIPAGSTVTIPDLPGDLGKLVFKSTDVGVSVHGKHIDVYTGEGREARRKMWQFTYEDDEDGKGLTTVCFQPPSNQ
ncbi:MAG TPA: 3D domain-containing protein [Pyrinomonadaceae bacterium]|nr:3D domain-containing protein [Pyrinomonadaceae bacterium]